MNLTLSIPEFANPFSALVWLFTHGGFVAVLVAIGYGIFWLYLEAIQNRYRSRQVYILLAVDVPRENEQTPKAVEHIFSHFHGIEKSPNLREKYIDGYLQAEVSIELVSIGGYIQFLVRAPVKHRDLVEAAIYAQYPQAEISEVEDYATKVPTRYPDPDWDLWGCELEMTKPDIYPIKTYPLWEHSLTQTFLDPMASLLEVMGRLHADEQIWLQWILKPTLRSAWRDRGVKEINKLAGIKGKQSAGLLESLANAPGQLLVGTYETLARTLVEPSETTQKRQKDDLPSLMLHLPPHIKILLEAIGMKISKLGFETKARFVYVSKREVFDKSRVFGTIGALKQFASLDMNGFKPDKKIKTKFDYWRIKARTEAMQRRIVLGYKNRSTWSGRTKFMMNIEELASVWHFPVLTVKAPQVKKSEAKRGEPPTSLPTGVLPVRPVMAVRQPAPAIEAAPPASPTHKGPAPENLPMG